MKNIAEVLEGVKTVGIGGHIRPDGDCVGSCMALYLYIRKYFPDIARFRLCLTYSVRISVSLVTGA